MVRYLLHNVLPYLLAIVLAVFLAKCTCDSIPAEYASIMMVTDEHEASLELDLGNSWNFGLESENDVDYNQDGLRDPDIYAKVLESQDFMDSLAITSLASHNNITYAEYLKRNHHDAPIIEWFEGERDNKWLNEKIKEHYLYKADHYYQTIKVQFKDADPMVAKDMAETVVEKLDMWLADYYGKKHIRWYKQALEKYEKSKNKYDALRERYAKAAAADIDAESERVHMELKSLKDDMERALSSARKDYVKVKRYEFLIGQPQPVFTVLAPASEPSEPCAPVRFGYMIAYVIVALIFTKWIKMFLRVKKLDWKIDVGDLSSPWLLSFVIWTVVLIGTMSVGDMLFPIGNQFWYAFFCWLPILCAASFVTYTLQTSRQSVRVGKEHAFVSSTMLFNFFFFIACLMTPLHLYKMWQQVSMLDPVHMLANIRTLAVDGDRGVYGFLNYASWINKALFIVALWRYPKISKLQLTAVVVLNLMSSFASMEKSGIFMMVIMTLFVLFSKGVIKARTIVYIMLGIVGLLYLFNVTLLSSANEDAEYEIFEFIGAYILTPPVAFSYLKPELEVQFGMHTLPHIYRIINTFGFDFEIHSLVGEFVNVPVLTNVYSVMDPFFVDFGYKGVAFFALIYGVLLGWAYSQFRKGYAFGKCLYTFSMFFIVMQYYMEEFFVGLYLNLFLVFIIYILTQEKIKLRPE